MAPVFGNGGRMLSEKSDYSVVFKKESVVGENQLVRCFFSGKSDCGLGKLLYLCSRAFRERVRKGCLTNLLLTI